MEERYTNHPRQRAVRKALRRRATPAERRFWEIVRDRRLGGFKFRRQHGVGRYVLDFYCAEARLGIELDGSIHDDPLRAAHDAHRQREIEALGIRVVRFQNRAVLDAPDVMAEAVLRALGGAQTET